MKHEQVKRRQGKQQTACTKQVAEKCVVGLKMCLLQSGAGRADAPRIRASLHDAASLLARFATKSSFSADAHGGGRESNMNTLPFMLQMARFLLDSVTASQRTPYQATLAVILAGDAEAAAAAATSADTTPPITSSSTLPRLSSSASAAATVRAHAPLPPQGLAQG